jgi:hypothetical protein
MIPVSLNFSDILIDSCWNLIFLYIAIDNIILLIYTDIDRHCFT